jgi:chemotaxis protein CheD
MSSIVPVGLGELAVSDRQADVIKTYGLGSCIAVVIYDRTRSLGGLLHVVYPESSVNPRRANDQPAYFADTGVPLLLTKMGLPGTANRRDILVRLTGGANMMDAEGRFNIGKRNLLAVKRELWKAGLGVYAEDSGGTMSRTAWIDIESGEMTVANGSRTWNL